MPKVGPQRAAEMTGRSKSTIQRAMNTGKLSYELDPAGHRVIDVSELERVFGLSSDTQDADISQSVKVELQRAAEMLESERVKMRVRILEEQLHMAQEQYEDMKSQRASWQKQAQQILLTSQYSQKQAEELKAELKEREARDVARRAALEERMKKLKEQSNNQNKKPETQNTESPLVGLWDMVKTHFVKKSA